MAGLIDWVADSELAEMDFEDLKERLIDGEYDVTYEGVRAWPAFKPERK